MGNYDMVAVVGPTASGKTALAVALAAALDGDVVSADSRQVYRRMDIGTGKDLDDYQLNGTRVPYHLIDIAEPGTKFNLFQYQTAFLEVYKTLLRQGRMPVLCGGSGLYIESVLKGYRMIPVPENHTLREELKGKSLAELTEILKGYKQLHNTTDVDTVKRAIRAIEIADYYRRTPVDKKEFPSISTLVVGVDIDRETRRGNISRRLMQRLDDGMIDEVKGLLDEGVKPEDLIYYGLEYKYVTLYLTGHLEYRYMVHELEVAIHQFSKRQMTWFRGMERRGVNIHWLPYGAPLQDKLNEIMFLLNNTLNNESRERQMGNNICSESR